jgi:hypothetical protein
VDIAPAVVAVHRHPSEEGLKEVVELLVLVICSPRVALTLVLRARAILLRSKTVVVGFFVSVNQYRVGVGDLFEDVLRSFMMSFVPSY